MVPSCTPSALSTRGRRRGACLAVVLMAACGSSHASLDAGSQGDDAAQPEQPAPGADAGSTGGGTTSGERDGSVSTADAAAPEDAGPAPVDAADPPPPDFDASVPESLVGKTYAETAFDLVAPSTLRGAFDLLVGDPGSTRVFVNDVREADGGTEIRYGSASPDADGGLAWQDVSPYRTFRIAPSTEDPALYVSERFTYTLRARVPNPANASTNFLLGLEAEDAVWAARASADFQQLTDGTLRGTITRAQAELRPLNLGAGCLALCPLSPVCLRTGGVKTLADLLDCAGSTRDVDSDGDGALDAYRLVIAFASERVDFPAAGQ
jgi:hypothetical protein